jgi:ParB family chromosome partitioning protein
MKDGKKESKPRSETYKIVDEGLIDFPDGDMRIEIAVSELEGLTESIREIGQLEPILVNKNGERFELIAGKRRLLASRRAEKKTMKCIVLSVDKKTAAVMRAAENLQRVDLTPIEEGYAYADLYDKAGMTIKMIAKRMGKSEYHVKRKLDLLRLDEEVQKAVHGGKISEGVAFELSTIEDKKELYRYLEIAVENGVTVQVAKLWTESLRKSLQYIAGESRGGEGRLEEAKETKQYATCDTCEGPVEYQDTKFLRICGRCLGIIRSAVSEGVFNK